MASHTSEKILIPTTDVQFPVDPQDTPRQSSRFSSNIPTTYIVNRKRALMPISDCAALALLDQTVSSDGANQSALKINKGTQHTTPPIGSITSSFVAL